MAKSDAGLPGPLTEDDMVLILEDIARHGRNQAAQIAAIKTLREIRGGETRAVDAFAQFEAPARAGVKLKAVKAV